MHFWGEIQFFDAELMLKLPRAVANPFVERVRNTSMSSSKPIQVYLYPSKSIQIHPNPSKSIVSSDFYIYVFPLLLLLSHGKISSKRFGVRQAHRYVRHPSPWARCPRQRALHQHQAVAVPRMRIGSVRGMGDLRHGPIEMGKTMGKSTNLWGKPWLIMVNLWMIYG